MSKWPLYPGSTFKELMRDARARRHELPVRMIKRELVALQSKLDATTDSEKRVLLKAEIAHLRRLKDNLGRRPPRKPPEAGVPVPAVPPGGPLPKHGGADAPLEFD